LKLISCQNGRLLTSLKSDAETIAPGKIIPTGFDALDDLLPDRGFERGAIHELLSSPEHGSPRTFALFLARITQGAIVWCDPACDLYPPAITSAGIPLDRVYLLRVEKHDDLVWSISQCLRCKGVAVTIAAVDRLSRIEARRLQLSAELGGGVGLLMRSMIQTRDAMQAPPIYAAATRLLVAPAPGEPTVQRWEIQLLHGHGGRLGKPVFLEHCRETNLVRPTEKLADRPVETIAAARA
jgi:protein ImuA